MSRSVLPVISHFQVKAILEAYAAGENEITVSLDLWRTDSKLMLDAEYAVFPDGQRLTREQLQIVLDNELACYTVQHNELDRIQIYSEAFSRYYNLMPTRCAPTMLVSGIPMHRIKDTDPYADTLSKIKAVAPVEGIVLDTTMGLGYTAIEAASSASQVITIELDPAVVEICRANPWSQDLFENPKITRLIGDAFDRITKFEDAFFTRVIHDPPMVSLAGHLYSAEFYGQLVRVLRPSGRLFHYVGDPKSRSGRNVTRGVVRRLKEAGFRRVKARARAFGVVAYK